MLYRDACQNHIAMMPSYLGHNLCCSTVSEEFLMVYRNARHKQLPLGCWPDMLAHTAHAVHSVLQAPQLAQPGWLHLNSGCHCHHDPAHSAGPISSRYASGLLSDPLSRYCVTCCCCGTFCCCQGRNLLLYALLLLCGNMSETAERLVEYALLMPAVAFMLSAYVVHNIRLLPPASKQQL